MGVHDVLLFYYRCGGGYYNINIIIISIEEEQGPTRTARGGGLEFICPRTSYFILSHPGPVLQFAVGVRPNEDPSRDLKKTLEEK
jgi:hypothetical protein